MRTPSYYFCATIFVLQPFSIFFCRMERWLKEGTLKCSAAELDSSVSDPATSSFAEDNSAIKVMQLKLPQTKLGQ